eukprot:TRINITY_DN34955_c0_g1_i1.p6 TRINITY_DN34955_c0_g1~~TRINITY_DN34955_c0_g1_i1.p6  ORF type:complete len:113 (-),score=30.16 TRINITY_DN34955_c0_g1_i1:598-936(-)
MYSNCLQYGEYGLSELEWKGDKVFDMVVIFCYQFFFLRVRQPPRSTHCISSAASDVYKRQVSTQSTWGQQKNSQIIERIGRGGKRKWINKETEKPQRQKQDTVKRQKSEEEM